MRRTGLDIAVPRGHATYSKFSRDYRELRIDWDRPGAPISSARWPRLFSPRALGTDPEGIARLRCRVASLRPFGRVPWRAPSDCLASLSERGNRVHWRSWAADARLFLAACG